MRFTQRKISPEAVSQLRTCPVQSVSAFALMLAPVYVHLKLNQKYVAVKAPLDFFTPPELVKWAPFEHFYLPEFVESVLPFREAARRIRAILSWDSPSVSSRGDPYPPVFLRPAPYEISDAVLRILGPLWASGAVIEPFFVAAFGNELCELLPGQMMITAREQNVMLFEQAIFRSSLGVFLALHLGYCDLAFLNRLRSRIFAETVGGSPRRSQGNEVDELVELCELSIGSFDVPLMTGDFFAQRPNRVALKLVSKLERVQKEFIRESDPQPTIYGEKGFLNV